MLQSEKFTKEFTAKISRAKFVYQSSKAQHDALQKIHDRLHTDYENIVQRRKTAEIEEQTLRLAFFKIHSTKEEEQEKFNKLNQQLNSLRLLKRKMKREKDIVETQLAKNTLSLNELIASREMLEKQNKSFQQRLNNIEVERSVLRQEFDRTSRSIQSERVLITELKNQISGVKGQIGQILTK